MNHKSKLTAPKALIKQAALVGFTVLSSAGAWAIPSDRSQPITLLADRATFSERTGVTTYTGNVVIEQGTMKLQADSIVANLNSKKEISVITATGRPAQFQQKTDPAKGVAKIPSTKDCLQCRNRHYYLIGWCTFRTRWC